MQLKGEHTGTVSGRFDPNYGMSLWAPPPP